MNNGLDVQLTDRWTRLRRHETQMLLWNDPSRFIVVPAGRRSGKTELAKRKLITKAINFHAASNGRFVFGAPTHPQAKEIFWDDLKAMVPRMFYADRRTPVSESDRTIYLYNGAKIQVIGLEKPERAEGTPIDGIVLDEYGNMKPDVWTKHVRPALSTPGRPGWAWFIGVPEGRNHYHQLYYEAISSKVDWKAFTWKTAEIDPEEAEKAKQDLDLLTYQQEYEGAFVTFEGMAYYAFDREFNCPPNGQRVLYDPKLPLILAFDFNRSPGVCSFLQEQHSPEWLDDINKRHIDSVTCGIGEVYIESSSNTEVVCDHILNAWGSIHKQDVLLYGDASGGAKTSQAVKGSDWDIITAKLRPVFGSRLKLRYGRSNPRIRSRVNSVNSRLKTVDGLVHTILDEKACDKLIRDLEGVSVTPSGDVEKIQGGMLSHISDAFGYYVHRKYPCGGKSTGFKRS